MTSYAGYFRLKLTHSLSVGAAQRRSLVPIRSVCEPLRRYSQNKAPFQALAAEEAPDVKSLTFSDIDKRLNGKKIILSYIWLRDNCRCSECINQDTRQRNFNTFEIPIDIKPNEATATESGLKVQWSHGSHASFYSWDFLEPYITGGGPKPEDVPVEHFGAKGHQGATIDYSEFEKDETRAVGRWTDIIVCNIISRAHPAFCLVSNRLFHSLFIETKGVRFRDWGPDRIGPADRRPPSKDRLHTRNTLRRLLRFHS